MREETIAAIATPPGKGGVAIVRMSGPDALSVAERMFVPSGAVKVKDFVPYRLYPGNICADGFSDYGLCVFFRAPRSYTGEDVVEFQCHGGESVARGILKKCFSLGARSAGRGEFTRPRLSQRQTFPRLRRGACGHDQRGVGGGGPARGTCCTAKSSPGRCAPARMN